MMYICQVNIYCIVGVGGVIGDVIIINMDVWEWDFCINVISMVLMSRYVILDMCKVGRGFIINMLLVSGCKFSILKRYFFWVVNI